MTYLAGDVLILDIDVSFGISRFNDSIADHCSAVAILKCGAVRANFFIVHNAIQEMIDLMDEGVLPANDMPVRPPVLPPGMVTLGH